jgi:hypothetical protein
LISGDEDLRERVVLPKARGSMSFLIGIWAANGKFNQSRELVSEADETIVLDRPGSRNSAPTSSTPDGQSLSCSVITEQEGPRVLAARTLARPPPRWRTWHTVTPLLQNQKPSRPVKTMINTGPARWVSARWIPSPRGVETHNT